MPITVTHTKVSGIADDPAASAAGQILPSDWDADHTITVDSLVIGALSTSSQLELTNWTVTSGGGTPPDYSTGNVQVKISGTLDASAAPGHLTGLQGIWNTVGLAASVTNVNGIRFQLDPGYVGSGIVRVADFQNYVAGTHTLGLGDVKGTIGATIESQGLSTGDNIGTYSIADGASNYNFASYNRSFRSTQGGTQLANVGVVGVADTDVHASIGGIFAIGNGNSGRWYPDDLGTSAALIADAQDSSASPFLAKINATDVFSITPTIGGVSHTPAVDSTTMFKVTNHAGTPLFNIDSSTPKVTLSAGLLVNLNSGTAPSFINGQGVLLSGQDGIANNFQFNSFGAGNTFLFVRAGGTNALPTALASGDSLGSLTFYGYNGASYPGNKSAINVVASQAWNLTANGTEIRIGVTPNNSTTFTRAITVQNSTGVSIGSALSGTDPGAGNLIAQVFRSAALAFASLPTGVAGMTAYITDSNTATWGATIAGGGANKVYAWYNGTNWTVMGA